MKNKNDVFRLSVLLGAEDRIYILPIVNHDMIQFIGAMRDEDVDLKQLGIMNRSKNEIYEKRRTT